LQVGGAERVTALMCRGLPSRGIAARAATFYESGPIGLELQREGLLLAQRLARARRDPASVGRLVRLLRRHRIDLIHTNASPLALGWGYLASRLAGTPAMTATVQFTLYPSQRRYQRLVRAASLRGQELVVEV